MKHPESRNVTTSTPWGQADYAYTYARGVICYGTPGHGGFHVSKTLNQQIPEALRNADGWYEEDCEANIPLYFLAHLFPQFVGADDLIDFRNSIKVWFPQQWERFSGEKVTAEESLIVAEEEFKAEHADDFVAVSAWGDWHENVPEGRVGVFAVFGAQRTSEANDKGRYFLVDQEEYDARGRHGFVIDPAKHESWQGEWRRTKAVV